MTARGENRSGALGRYVLAALIVSSIPMVALVNGCDSGGNAVVQPDGSTSND